MDLKYLAAELPSRHLNAFHTISKAAFDSAVVTLDSLMPAWDVDQRFVGLQRLVARIGDGHTHLDLPPSWPRLPIELAWYSDGLWIVAAAAPYHNLFGSRVTGVGSVAIDSVMKLVSELVPRGENAARTRFTATPLITSAAVMHGLRLTTEELKLELKLVHSSGRDTTVTLHALPLTRAMDWCLTTPEPPLWLQHLEQGWWTEILPDGKTVYLSFSRYPAQGEFEQRSRELVRMFDDTTLKRLVIDLRRNEGGDFTLVRRFLQPLLKNQRVLNRDGGLYVIIGPGTFSAAMVNALDFRNELKAFLVGEPTGARPNSYSEHGDFLLPHSGLRVSYSLRHYEFGSDSAEAVEPDKRIESTWQDVRAGHDPVVAWILMRR